MSDKPKRKFWQFHLSTAVLLMFIGAVLGLENTRGYEPNFEIFVVASYNGPVTCYGWPACCCLQTSFIQWFVPSLIINLTTGLGICSLITFISEYTIRRNDAR